MSATENKEPVVGSVFDKILAQAKEQPNFIEIEVLGEKVRVKRVKDAFEGNRLAREASAWVKQTTKRVKLPGCEELKALWPEVIGVEEEEMLKGAFLIQHLLDPQPTEMQVLQLLREAGPMFVELVNQVQAAAAFTAEVNEQAELEETKND